MHRIASVVIATALLLVGCAGNPLSRALFPTTTERVASPQVPQIAQAPRIEVAATQAATPSVSPSSVAFFPTSVFAAATAPWTTMHEGGYKGNFDTACELLGLGKPTDLLCKKYQKMVDNNECQVVDIPNGVVLDRLLFTDRETGKNTVQYRAPVKLVNPPTRQVTLCKLAANLYVGRAPYCNNHFLIRSGGTMPVAQAPTPQPAPVVQQPKPLAPTPAVQVASALPAGCEAGILNTNGWDYAVLPLDMQRAVDAAEVSNRPEWDSSKSFSGQYGAKLRRMADVDKVLKRTTRTPSVQIGILGPTGVLGEQHTVAMKDGKVWAKFSPKELPVGSTIQVLTPEGFASPSVNPTTGKRELRLLQWTHCTMNVHVVMK